MGYEADDPVSSFRVTGEEAGKPPSAPGTRAGPAPSPGWAPVSREWGPAARARRRGGL